MDQPGGGRAAEQFAKMGKDERKKRQKGWKARVKFNGRWIIKITISSFKRMLGEALRAVNLKCVMTERPPRWRHATRPGTPCGRRRGDAKAVRQRPRHAGPMSIRASKSR